MKQKLIFFSLFITTFITTTFAGLEWVTPHHILFDECGNFGVTNATWDDIFIALKFSIPFLLILTAHEFGHYFMAVYYKAKVTLPYYIPLWFFGFTQSIGTMGAFIRIKSPLLNTKQFFDVGIAGPLAGFVVAIGFIWYGFATLPEPDYIYNLHPDYETAFNDHKTWDDVYSYPYIKQRHIEQQQHCNPEQELTQPDGFEVMGLGDNLVFIFFRWAYSDDAAKIPNQFELFHYPFLFAGFLACFFTALNLVPIGQLDGGHVLYGLLGHRTFNKISPYVYMFFLFYAGLGLITPDMLQDDLIWYIPLYLYFLSFCLSRVYPVLKTRLIRVMAIFIIQYGLSFLFPEIEGYAGWLLFGLIIGRFLGVQHPASMHEIPLDTKRKVMGWIAVVVFILCLSPQPFLFMEVTAF